MYTLLARHTAMEVILEALRETPSDAAVVAAIVRLAALFREHRRSSLAPLELGGASRLFLQEEPATDGFYLL